MIVIGITGTLGAGKGTVVTYLTQEKGFRHYSVRDFLRQELTSRQMPVNRDTLTAIANALRAKHGPAYIIEQLFAKALEQEHHCVIESIRTAGEIGSLRRHKQFYLLAIDADPRLRYKRIRSRNSETDQVSYNTFIKNEEREMHSADANKQNLAACIAEADYVINNNGSLRQLNNDIEHFLKNVSL